MLQSLFDQSLLHHSMSAYPAVMFLNQHTGSDIALQGLQVLCRGSIAQL